MRLAHPFLALFLAFGLTAASGAATSTATHSTVVAAKARAKKARKKVRTLLRKRGIANLPSVSSALAGHAGGALRTEAVTGTPPLLVGIPGSSIENVFWKPGVVDAIAGGTATPEQCSEFWTGIHDGDSGGMGACNMAESVGYSFSNILESDRSLCYMKRFPTRANQDAGAIEVVSGALPGGDVSRLFSVPSGSDPRIVKVTVSGDPDGGSGGGSKDIFLRVSSAAQNQAAGNFYNVDLWYCKSGPGGAADGFDHITIAQSGHLVSESASDGGGQGAYLSTVEGFLTFGDGTIAYDTTKSRHARISAARGSSEGFKGDVEIRNDDTIVTKSYEASQQDTRQAYFVTSFSGTGPASLRFLAGAFMGRNSRNGSGFDDGFTGATEFRTSFYAAAPGSDLKGQLAGVSFDSDDFFASPPVSSVDASGFSCTTTPDVALALDFANATMRAAVAPCADRSFDGMHFCHDDQAVNAAESAFFQSCAPGH